MADTFPCPNCATVFSVTFGPEDQRYRCTKCDTVFSVPAASSADSGEATIHIPGAAQASPSDDNDATYRFDDGASLPAPREATAPIAQSEVGIPTVDPNDATIVGESDAEVGGATIGMDDSSGDIETYQFDAEPEDDDAGQATIRDFQSEADVDHIDDQARTIAGDEIPTSDDDAATFQMSKEDSAKFAAVTSKKPATEAFRKSHLHLDEEDYSGDVTIQGETADKQRLDDVAATWRDAITPDMTPMTSIKGDAGAISSSVSQVIVRQRLLTEKEKAPDKPGDYEILSKLGEGGMGVVFTARQTSVDRTIAVKMVRANVAQQGDVREKFIGEAAVTADLEHPNIVPVYDLGVDNRGCLFYAMKKVKGTPWDDVIENKDLEENIEILLKVCDAIAFSHSRGIIHRDLKPENVMLGDFGEVLVMDWGLSASIRPGGKAECLGPGSPVCGTPAYMAPEMALGESSQIGTCSDIYLLGAILYEIACGLKPHTGKSVMECVMNAAENVIQETPLDFELIDIAKQAMATDPADRYADVQAFKDAVKEYQDHFESTSICQKAREMLNRAERSGEYADYNRAIFGFEEAVSMWEGNDDARVGVKEARLAYSAVALEAGDLDLAASQLIPGEPDHDDLAVEVDRAQRTKRARQRRLKILTVGMVFLVAAIFVVISVAYARVNEQKKIAEDQRQLAEQKRLEAEKQTRFAKEQQGIAEQQRQAADAAEDRAVKALADAQAAIERANKAKTAEERALALQQAAEATAGEMQARLEREREIRENRWWVLQADQARERQQLAAKALNMPIERTVDLGGGATLPLRLIPKGEFGMGSSERIKLRSAEEVLHRVSLSYHFYIGAHEVTNAEWTAVTGEKREGADPRAPVRMISINDVTGKFLAALQTKAPEGWEFRLPTEAEWEYACRAGTNTPYYAGAGEDALKSVGWASVNAEDVHPVSEKAPNAWGLYDMHGNVSEWCVDTYDSAFYKNSLPEDPVNHGEGEYRVVRGGGYVNLPEHCRSAYRSYAHPENRYDHLGFRVVLAPKDSIAAPPSPADNSQ